MESRQEPTVFVVDDDKPARQSLSWLIESVGLKVESFSTAREFLDEYDPSWPGCLVLDVRMPGMSGLELQNKLTNDKINIPVIIITGHPDVPMAVRAMRLGAVDFIAKPVNDQVLLDRINQAIEKDAQYRRQHGQFEQIAAHVAELTPRERQVMDLVVEGKPNRQIAKELSVSEKTVEVHRAHVMEKMKAEGVVDLVKKYVIYNSGDGVEKPLKT